MAQDYYELLGVARDATTQDIKRAFRQIARECHPDVSGDDPDAAERFKKSRVAYETLMDPVTRARYDRRGQRRSNFSGGSFFDAFYKGTANKGDGKDTPGSTGGGASGPSRGSHVGGGARGAKRRAQHDPRNNIGLDDLFNVGDFGFGFGARGASGAAGATGPGPGGPAAAGAPPPREAPEGPQPGHDVPVELDVPAEIASRGGSVTAVYYRMQRSDSWRPGAEDSGLVRVQDIADVRIVPGTRDGTVLRERGLGDAGPYGGPYGDLLARVRLVGKPTGDPRHYRGPSPPPPARPSPTAASPSPRTEATAPRSPSARSPGPSGDDEVHVLDISVAEAMLGGRVALDTPQGRVRLSIPPGSSSGSRLRLRGKGSGGPSAEASDLYVELRIVVPRTLDDESRQLIEAFAQLNPGDPRSGE